MRQKSTSKCCLFSNFYYNNIPGLVSNSTSNTTNKIERKISENGAVRAGKVFPLYVSNKDLNDIIEIIKSLVDSGVLIDGVTKTVLFFFSEQL